MSILWRKKIEHYKLHIFFFFFCIQFYIRGWSTASEMEKGKWNVENRKHDRQNGAWYKVSLLRMWSCVYTGRSIYFLLDGVGKL